MTTAPSACPVCGKAFPAMHGGRIRRRVRFRRAIETWAWWCLFCETWWVVDISRSVARRPAREAGTTVSAIRRASRVESDQARRVRFTDRGLYAPVD